MASDPVPSAAIFDATTGGRSVIVVTGGSTGDVLTLQANGTYAAATPSGGSLSGTGAVDNAVLRADGTGGATLQNSAFVIADNATASPNNTVNHASIQTTGGTTNVSVSVVPKGTGAFMLSVPDGTSAGGNVRGANAIDLQTLRTAATQVAGEAGVAIGIRDTAAAFAVAIGVGSAANGTYAVSVGGFCSSAAASVAIGDTNTTSADGAVAIGKGNTAGLNQSVAIGGSISISSNGYHAVGLGRGHSLTNFNTLATGWSALCDRQSQQSHSSGNFAALGDSQSARFVLRNKTTNATPTTLFADGSAARLTIPSGKILFADILVSGIKSDGSAAGCYKRKVAIKNVAGTTALVGTVETIGTDIEDNASTDVAITADNTNDALEISVTGIASETWRWVAVVEGLEIAYGS